MKVEWYFRKWQAIWLIFLKPKGTIISLLLSSSCVCRKCAWLRIHRASHARRGSLRNTSRDLPSLPLSPFMMGLSKTFAILGSFVCCWFGILSFHFILLPSKPYSKRHRQKNLVSPAQNSHKSRRIMNDKRIHGRKFLSCCIDAFREVDMINSIRSLTVLPALAFSILVRSKIGSWGDSIFRFQSIQLTQCRMITKTRTLKFVL